MVSRVEGSAGDRGWTPPLSYKQYLKLVVAPLSYKQYLKQVVALLWLPLMSGCISGRFDNSYWF